MLAVGLWSAGPVTEFNVSVWPVTPLVIGPTLIVVLEVGPLL